MLGYSTYKESTLLTKKVREKKSLIVMLNGDEYSIEENKDND